VWFGLAVTGVFLWLVMRDVPFGAVARDIAGARWGPLLGISIPAYLLAVYLRALRWRHLTDPIQRIPTGPLFRAVAVGFMANNIFPLRMGEVVRSWYLARETGVGVPAVFGTIVLERVLDIVTVVSLAFGVIAVWGTGSDSAIARGAVLLLPAAAVPILVLAGLRVAPEQVIAAALWCLRPLPQSVSAFTERALRGFGQGLGALRGGRHLFWIAFHSLTIWLVASTLPLIAGWGSSSPRPARPCGRPGSRWPRSASPWPCHRRRASSGPTTSPAGWPWSASACPRRAPWRWGPSATRSSGSASRPWGWSSCGSGRPPWWRWTRPQLAATASQAGKAPPGARR
jgi:hypothetical protein